MQLEESAAHPKAPPEHEGPVHRYLLTAFNSPPLGEGMPIIVNGTPVVLEMYEKEEIDPSRTVALAEAIYRYSEDLVPVQGWTEETEGYPKITECEFEVTERESDVTEPPGASRPAWGIRPAADINVSFKVEGMGTSRIPADFDLTGYSFHDMHVRFVPGRTDEQELQGAIIRGYWDDTEYIDSNQRKHDLREREKEVRNMMEAAFRDTVQAFRNELEQLVSNFYPNLPHPEVAVSAVSRDGRTVVVFNPAGNTQ